MIRMNVVPLFVSAGVAFTHIGVDRGEEYDARQVKSLIDGAASHLVILTPGIFLFLFLHFLFKLQC